MLLLLHLQCSPILERPLGNIRLGRCTLDLLALLQLAPERGEFGELDEVPDGAEWGFDDGGFADEGGGWDGGHFGGGGVVD